MKKAVTSRPGAPKPSLDRATPAPRYDARRRVVLGLLALAALGLVARAIERQIIERDFLRGEGERRFLRIVEMPAHRGVIMDRNGEKLAVSAPVVSIAVNPRVLPRDTARLLPLARALDLDYEALRRKLTANARRSFLYLKRGVDPSLAGKVRDLARGLDLRGIEFQREYHRFYPSGEITAHVVGLTDIDDQGIEGMELADDAHLRAHPGRKRVIRDGRHRVIEDLERIEAPRDGRDLTLSIDRRLQYIAYRELKAAVARHHARAGSLVLLDVRSGEILALVNQPSFNPNKPGAARRGALRNRALTDVAEPGSTMKPFTVAAALDLGAVSPDAIIDTRPGYLRIGRDRVSDHHPLGRIDLGTLLAKSSNVGAAKLALALDSEAFHDYLAALGLGRPTGIGFPGEVSGRLAPAGRWRRFEQATMSFGYGLSVTPLQLAAAYAVIAADGVKRPLSLRKREAPAAGRQVMKPATARLLRKLLQRVVEKGGTAPRAAIPGFSVAGKTGTTRKLVHGRYSNKQYRSLFVGMAPASRPRYVLLVMIDEPKGREYYGGAVAAPVFSRVMSETLRLMNVVPDQALDGAPRLRLAALDGVAR